MSRKTKEVFSRILVRRSLRQVFHLIIFFYLINIIALSDLCQRTVNLNYQLWF